MRRRGPSSRPAPPGAAALTDETDRRAGCGAEQGRAFLARVGQIDGSQDPDLSAAVVIGAGGLIEGSLQVRPRRSRSDILRRMVLAEEEEEDDDDADAKESAGSAVFASRGLRGGETDLVRRGRGERPSTPPPSSPCCSLQSVSWRMGERQPTRIRPERKSSSAELMVVVPPAPSIPRWRAANSKSPGAVQKSPSAEGA